MARKRRRRRRRKNPAGIPTWLLIAGGIGAFIFYKKKKEDGESKDVAKDAVQQGKAQATEQAVSGYFTF